MVFFDRVCEGIDTARIVTDDLQSAYNATDHLIGQGCRQIAFLAISEGLSISHQRIEGYKEALAANGIKFSSSNIVPCTHDAEENLRSLKKVMRQKDRPDGIICSGSAAALAIVAGIEDAGMNIGNEVDVAAKQSTEILHWFRPGLIVVEESFKLAGQQLGKAILGRINGKDIKSLQTIG